MQCNRMTLSPSCHLREYYISNLRAVTNTDNVIETIILNIRTAVLTNISFDRRPPNPAERRRPFHFRTCECNNRVQPFRGERRADGGGNQNRGFGKLPEHHALHLHQQSGRPWWGRPEWVGFICRYLGLFLSGQRGRNARGRPGSPRRCTHQEHALPGQQGP